MINLILSGGSGTRLWPVSRTLWPKQFYPLIDGASLFSLTLQRNRALCNGFLVVTNFEQYPLARLQMREELRAPGQGFQKSDGTATRGLETATPGFGTATRGLSGRCILEPVGRNTAPAIALACLGLPPDEVVLVTPSDHLITKTEAYAEAVREAESLARAGYLVTFGIQPTYPETGFGYIEANDRDVLSFREKPDRATAESYLQAGRYFWNSGMFCFRAGTFLAELLEHAPEVHRTAVEAWNSLYAVDEQAQTLTRENMMKMPDISIDYGIMEKSRRVKVVPADLGWSDLGSFDALYELLPRNGEGNTRHSNARYLNSHNNLLLNDSGQLLVLQGVDDLMVVHTDTATYIGRRGESQHVKQVVDLLKSESSELLRAHAHRATLFGSQTRLSGASEPLTELNIMPGSTCTIELPGAIQLWVRQGSAVLVNEQSCAAGDTQSVAGGVLIVHNRSESEHARLLLVGSI
ncbi:MAG: mannose-1-phosphate guanylyltransferase/mannose-6-phosphate isomerase [Bacteroidetes bacterium]|nr:mannose-1-phosphate guanylyltransferase/mannose-6-phosphate isomerase [Bacteroidota bacterium]